MKKPLPIRRVKKEDRELRVLFGLIELYIETGKPVGSHTLQESGFQDLSSATIRNYCAKLEEMGFLMQHHSSGGRIPTEQAFSIYAKECLNNIEHQATIKLDAHIINEFNLLQEKEAKEPALYINYALEVLSNITGLAVFASSPRFDHDFIASVKLIAIDVERIVAIIITQFGLIQTETLHIEKKLSAFSLKRLEHYFLSKLNANIDELPHLDNDENRFAEHIYHEVMIRYIARYSNFSESDIYQTGFSKLLKYQELAEPITLANSLALFENKSALTSLLKDSMKGRGLSIYIGDELKSFSYVKTPTQVIAIPYFLNQSIAGAIGIVGPFRIPYKQVMTILKIFSSILSQNLTNSLYKFKLNYRKPQLGRAAYLEIEDTFFLEDKSQDKTDE
jgi:heat-inducible transcriptional repressor